MGLLIKSLTKEKYDKVIEDLNQKFDLVGGPNLKLLLEENVFAQENISVVGSGKETIHSLIENGYRKGIFAEVYTKPNDMPVRFIHRFGNMVISPNYSWYSDIKKSERVNRNDTYVIIIPVDYNEEKLIEQLSVFLTNSGVELKKKETPKKIATKTNKSK